MEPAGVVPCAKAKAARPKLRMTERMQRLYTVLVPFGFKKALGFDGGHTSSTRRCDGLSISPVLDVARVKDARHVGPRAAVRDDVAVGIEIDLSDEGRGVRNMAYGYEEAV